MIDLQKCLVKICKKHASGTSWWHLPRLHLSVLYAMAFGQCIGEVHPGTQHKLLTGTRQVTSPEAEDSIPAQVFRDAGLKSPVAGSVAMGASNVVGTLLAAFLMDRLGRRPLLLFSHSAMAVCLLTMSAAQFSPGATFSPHPKMPSSCTTFCQCKLLPPGASLCNNLAMSSANYCL